MDTTDRESETSLGRAAVNKSEGQLEIGVRRVEKTRQNAQVESTGRDFQDRRRRRAAREGENLRLRVGLAARGLATRLSTSHFCGWVCWTVLVEKLECESRKTTRWWRNKSSVVRWRVDGWGGEMGGAGSLYEGASRSSDHSGSDEGSGGARHTSRAAALGG